MLTSTLRRYTVVSHTVYMAKPKHTRKVLFLAALKLEGKTVEQWASEQPNEKTGGRGVSTAHLYEVLNDTRTSAPLDGRIDAVVQKHFGDSAIPAA